MARPISYLALAKGTPIFASDESEIGTVVRVIADDQNDIFSGIEMSSGILTGNRFVPADLVEGITDESVQLSITSEEADAKLAPQE